MSIVAWDDFLEITTPELPKCPIASIKEALARSASEFCERSLIWEKISIPINTIAGKSDYNLTFDTSISNVVEYIWDVKFENQDNEYNWLNPTSPEFLKQELLHRSPDILRVPIVSSNPVNGIVSCQLNYGPSIPDVVVGDNIYISGDTTNSYNGLQTITDVLSPYVGFKVLSNSPLPVSAGIITVIAARYTGLPRYYAQIDDSILRFYPAPNFVDSFIVSASIKPSRTNPAGIDSFIYESYSEAIAAGAIYRLSATPKKEWSNPDIAQYYQAVFENGINKAISRRTHYVTPRSRPTFF